MCSLIAVPLRRALDEDDEEGRRPEEDEDEDEEGIVGDDDDHHHHRELVDSTCTNSPELQAVLEANGLIYQVTGKGR